MDTIQPDPSSDHAPTIGGAVDHVDEEPRPVLLAVTSCPVGIANTFMAADCLERAARAAGADIVVETQGCSDMVLLTAEQVAAADAVIFACDDSVDGRERFAGLPVIESGVRRAIVEPNVMVDEALAAIDDAGASTVVAGGPSPDVGQRAESTSARAITPAVGIALTLAVIVVILAVVFLLSG